MDGYGHNGKMKNDILFLLVMMAVIFVAILLGLMKIDNYITKKRAWEREWKEVYMTAPAFNYCSFCGTNAGHETTCPKCGAKFKNGWGRL